MTECAHELNTEEQNIFCNYTKSNSQINGNQYTHHIWEQGHRKQALMHPIDFRLPNVYVAITNIIMIVVVMMSTMRDESSLDVLYDVFSEIKYAAKTMSTTLGKTGYDIFCSTLASFTVMSFHQHHQ